MKAKDVLFSSISEVAVHVEAGDVRAVELLDACIEQIEQHEPRLNAFITRTLDLAREQAIARDRETSARGVRSALHGIPVAIKDVFDLEGFATTAGSRVVQEQAARRTATAVSRLLDAGAVILGKTNMDEFARGGTSLDSCFGATPNPWNPHHTPGGSSGGSAVAVAAGMAFGALGTDTGGSVVGPAGFCNLSGIRPTFGRVSRAGVVPLGPSFDTIGPITRTVRDAALMLQALAGPDSADTATGRTPPPDFLQTIDEGVERLRVGVPVNYVWPGYEPEVESIVRTAIRDLESLGARVVEVELPWAEISRSVYNAVVSTESAEYHRVHLRERRDAYVSPGADFFEQGLFMPGWRYVQGQKARTLLMQQAATLFRRVDVIVAPTAPIAAPSFDACRLGTVVQAPISHCKRPFSPLGVPVLALPVGFTAGGLPVGMQVVGRWAEEALLFRAGRAYEAARPWWQRRPPLDSPPSAVAGFNDWARAAEEEVPMHEANRITEHDIGALAAAIRHPVDPRRLAVLTHDVNRELARLAQLDDLDVDGLPRADHLDLLALDPRHLA